MDAIETARRALEEATAGYLAALQSAGLYALDTGVGPDELGLVVLRAWDLPCPSSDSRHVPVSVSGEPDACYHCAARDVPRPTPTSKAVRDGLNALGLE